LQIIAKYQFPAHIITESKLVTCDLEIIQMINQINARVSFSISTSADNLAEKIEPGASKPYDRFRAMREIAPAGVKTGVILMPVLQFI
jgi:DNA repair photolyase